MRRVSGTQAQNFITIYWATSDWLIAIQMGNNFEVLLPFNHFHPNRRFFLTVITEVAKSNLSGKINPVVPLYNNSIYIQIVCFPRANTVATTTLLSICVLFYLPPPYTCDYLTLRLKSLNLPLFKSKTRLTPLNLSIIFLCVLMKIF